MFGQTENTSFSGCNIGTQNNPFAQSTFGKPITTPSFDSGAAPVFDFGKTTSTTNLGCRRFARRNKNRHTSANLLNTQQNTDTNLVGTTKDFGTTTTTNDNTALTGTVVKFMPVITTDSTLKNGISHSISTQHCCITAMKEYESKSFEELRFEDYQVGQEALFRILTQTSPFGSATTDTSTADTGTGFGLLTDGFDTTSQSKSTFGKHITNFGTSATTTTTNSFAFSTTPTTNLFDANNTKMKPFGTTASSLFGNANQTTGTNFNSINAKQNTGFGFTFGRCSAQPNQNSGRLFDQTNSAFNIPSMLSNIRLTNIEEQVESLVQEQYEVHNRMSRMVDNLNKLEQANITTGAIQSRLTMLESYWSRFEVRHRILLTMHRDAIRRHDYIKNDFFGKVEETYLFQKGVLLDMFSNVAKSYRSFEPAATAELSDRNKLLRIISQHFLSTVVFITENL